MNKALWKIARNEHEVAAANSHRFSRKMSDHIAFALLVYTGLNIVLTVGAIKGAMHGSILPYFSLVLLVGMIIPACRHLERRWEHFEAVTKDELLLQAAFRRDRALVWIAAIVLPISITVAFKLIAPLIQLT
jgi:hypothetical protein